jgi:hypothetical protein
MPEQKNRANTNEATRYPSNPFAPTPGPADVVEPGQ